MQNLRAVKSFTDGANWAYASLSRQLPWSSVPMGAVFWNAGFITASLASLGGFFVYFLLEAARFVSFKN